MEGNRADNPALNNAKEPYKQDINNVSHSGDNHGDNMDEETQKAQMDGDNNAQSNNAVAVIQDVQTETDSGVHTSQLTITQSESVEGDEMPTQMSMVDQQLAAEEEKNERKKQDKKRQKAIHTVKKNLSLGYGPEENNEDQPTPRAVELPISSTPLLSQTAAPSNKRKRTSRSKQPESQSNEPKNDRQLRKRNKQVMEEDPVSEDHVIDDDADGDYTCEEEQSEQESEPEESEKESTEKESTEDSKKGRSRKVTRKRSLKRPTIGRLTKPGCKKRKDTGSNYTVRCSLKEVWNMLRSLSPRQKEELIDVGWGFLFDFKVKTNISRPMIIWLFNFINRVTLTMDLGAGRKIEINPDVVEAVFGFPQGKETSGLKETPPRPSDYGDTTALKWLKQNLGMPANSKKHVTVKTLIDHIKLGLKDEFSMKCIFLVIFKTLVCPTQHARVSTEAGMVHHFNYKNARNMNIARVVVDELKRAVSKFHDSKKNQKMAEACAVLPLILYLDHVKCPASLLTNQTPRLHHLTTKMLRSIMRADKQDETDKHGNPIFGKLSSWKSGEELKHYDGRPKRKAEEGIEPLKEPKRHKKDVAEQQKSIVVADPEQDIAVQGCEESDYIDHVKEYGKDLDGLLDQLALKFRNPPSLYPENEVRLNKTFTAPLHPIGMMCESTRLSVKAFLATQIAKAKKALNKQKRQHRTPFELEQVTYTATVTDGLKDAGNPEDSTVPEVDEEQNLEEQQKDNSATPIGDSIAVENEVQILQSNATMSEEDTVHNTGELKDISATRLDNNSGQEIIEVQQAETMLIPGGENSMQCATRLAQELAGNRIKQYDSNDMSNDVAEQEIIKENAEDDTIRVSDTQIEIEPAEKPRAQDEDDYTNVEAVAKSAVAEPAKEDIKADESKEAEPNAKEDTKAYEEKEAEQKTKEAEQNTKEVKAMGKEESKAERQAAAAERTTVAAERATLKAEATTRRQELDDREKKIIAESESLRLNVEAFVQSCKRIDDFEDDPTQEEDAEEVKAMGKEESKAEEANAKAVNQFIEYQAVSPCIEGGEQVISQQIAVENKKKQEPQSETTYVDQTIQGVDKSPKNKQDIASKHVQGITVDNSKNGEDEDPLASRGQANIIACSTAIEKTSGTNEGSAIVVGDQQQTIDDKDMLEQRTQHNPQQAEDDNVLPVGNENIGNDAQTNTHSSSGEEENNKTNTAQSEQTGISSVSQSGVMQELDVVSKTDSPAWNKLYALVSRFSSNKIDKEMGKKLKKTTLIEHIKDDQGTASVYHVSSSFRPGGLLEDSVADQTIKFLQYQLKGSKEKKIMDYRLSQRLFDLCIGNKWKKRDKWLDHTFSSNNADKLDQYNQIMFPFLQGGEEDQPVGHWFTLSIDLMMEKFKIFDSLRGSENVDIELLCEPLIRKIRSLWNAGFSNSSIRFSLDGFKVEYADMPQQTNKYDCGFVMLYMLENSHSDYVKEFSQEDIQSYKELLLMRMLTSSIFNIHVQNLDDKILGLKETEFIKLLPNKKIEDCKDDIVLGIKERMAQIEAKRSTPIEGASLLANIKSRYSKKRANQKQPNDSLDPDSTQALQKPPKRPPYSPTVFNDGVNAKSVAKLLKQKTFLAAHENRVILKKLKQNYAIEKPVSWTVADLSAYVSKDVWIDCEFIDSIVSKWASYKEFNYIFQEGRRIVLPTDISELCLFSFSDQDDSNFEVEQRASALVSIIGNIDLTEAYLITLPVHHKQHFTVYALNRYVQGGRVDILDSFLRGGIPKQKEYHQLFGKKLLHRLQQLLNYIYPGNDLPDWSSLFDTAHFVKSPHQDDRTSCGVFALYFMQYYDGEKLVGDKRKAKSGVLREEYVYSEIFHESNEAFEEDFPEQLMQFAPDDFKRPEKIVEVDECDE